jgi:hypothetical protein
VGGVVALIVAIGVAFLCCGKKKKMPTSPAKTATYQVDKSGTEMAVVSHPLGSPLASPKVEQKIPDPAPTKLPMPTDPTDIELTTAAGIGSTSSAAPPLQVQSDIEAQAGPSGLQSPVSDSNTLQQLSGRLKALFSPKQSDVPERRGSGTEENLSDRLKNLFSPKQGGGESSTAGGALASPAGTAPAEDGPNQLV